ncbi:hypothetical protein LR394_34070 [Kineosporia babensis]|uniref:Uncharacterized protein n=2 Tax=Kineosporia babensis TaxID=499548 RepID=A0A9X1NLT8_9ACTN|nr:DUF6578 domain-containing protein [Kineosporia babensis]MCD5315934.1 hypothetical protein [Kineosporia babensis]
MSRWQLECCGDSFGVGAQVRWPVGLEEESGSEELLEVLDLGWARRVRYREDHHEVCASGVLAGTVASIDGVTCSMELMDDIARVRVPGSGLVCSVPDVAAAYPLASDGRSLVGWIIGFDAVDYEPYPQPAGPALEKPATAARLNAGALLRPLRGLAAAARQVRNGSRTE